MIDLYCYYYWIRWGGETHTRILSSCHLLARMPARFDMRRLGIGAWGVGGFTIEEEEENEIVKKLFDVIAIEKWICGEQQETENENENSVTELCRSGDDDMNVSWRGFYVSGR